MRTYLQSSEFTLDSELAKIAFNCSITCNVTGVSQKSMPGEHLANIQDCNLVFQVWSNNTIVDELNCTRPKEGYVYRHENRRDGRVIRHVHPLKKGRFSFRYTKMSAVFATVYGMSSHTRRNAYRHRNST